MNLLIHQLDQRLATLRVPLGIVPSTKIHILPEQLQGFRGPRYCPANKLMQVGKLTIRMGFPYLL